MQCNDLIDKRFEFRQLAMYRSWFKSLNRPLKALRLQRLIWGCQSLFRGQWRFLCRISQWFSFLHDYKEIIWRLLMIDLGFSQELSLWLFQIFVGTTKSWSDKKVDWYFSTTEPWKTHQSNNYCCCFRVVWNLSSNKQSQATFNKLNNLFFVLVSNDFLRVFFNESQLFMELSNVAKCVQKGATDSFSD